MATTQTGVVIGGVAPTTNLNIGMDYWGAAGSSPVPAMHGKASSVQFEESNGMKESSRSRKGSSLIGNQHVDPGCASRLSVKSFLYALTI